MLKHKSQKRLKRKLLRN